MSKTEKDPVAEFFKKLTPKKVDNMIAAIERLNNAGLLAKEESEQLKWLAENLKTVMSDVVDIKKRQSESAAEMANLNKGFVEVIALLGSGAQPKTAAQATSSVAAAPVLVYKGLQNLGLSEAVLAKLEEGKEPDGKRCIRKTQFLPTGEWNAVNKLVRQFNFKWTSFEDKKQNRWVEQ